MKRIIIYIVFIIIFTSLGFIGLTYEKVDSPSENILNNTFYKYNTSSGLYESIKFNSKIVSYNGEELDLKGCDTYSYIAVSSIVKFTCGRAFRIIADTNEVLAISMNENNYYFFSTKENSFEYEFKKQFGSTYSEYKSNKLNKEKEITEEKLNELINEQSTSYIYIKNNKCDYTCALIEEKLNNLNNSYYISVENITREDLLNSITESTKPIILTLGSGYVKKTTINIKGFDVKELNEYLKESENEEENNQRRN